MCICVGMPAFGAPGGGHMAGASRGGGSSRGRDSSRGRPAAAAAVGSIRYTGGYSAVCVYAACMPAPLSLGVGEQVINQAHVGKVVQPRATCKVIQAGQRRRRACRGRRRHGRRRQWWRAQALWEREGEGVVRRGLRDSP